MSLLVCALAELSSRFEGEVVDTTPDATTSYERVQQVRYEPIERIELVGNEREHRRETAVLMAKNETTPSATTLDVVEIAFHASPFNKLGINQSNGSNLLGKMRSSSQATIKGHGGSRFI
jgi:hypothetical protein